MEMTECLLSQPNQAQSLCTLTPHVLFGVIMVIEAWVLDPFDFQLSIHNAVH